MNNELERIHESLLNGQRGQMVNQIQEYGGYDFWEDYRSYLKDVYLDTGSVMDYFSDAVISYFRIVNR